MELTLEHGEAALLERILANYLSDLRMEITDTEDYDLRESMKQDEETIKGLIERLHQTQHR